MIKDPIIFIEHIIESIEVIEGYVVGLNKDSFLVNREKQDAVIRRLEIIGEAAKNLPEDARQIYSEIEWGKIVAMRNLLIHEYFGIDLNLVWSVVENKLPELKNLLNKALAGPVT